MDNVYTDNNGIRIAADKLKRLSMETDDVRAAAASVMGYVGASWQGPASDAFLETGAWIIKDIERLQRELEELAVDVENAAP